MKQTYQTVVRMDEALRKDLEDLSEELDRPMGWVMRKAAQEYIAKHKESK